jgi:hypothetical protein
MSKPPQFVGAMARVWVLLQRGREVPVDELYEAAYSHLPPVKTPRCRQQRVGAIISHINAELQGRKIGPGDKRRTYRLRRIG